jgi:two-component system CheB/CheR fusion protein
VALIFIPHLDPTHESAMVELLSRTTRLQVVQAAEGMRVEVNSVYVLPPNSDMTIGDGVLHLVRREAGRGHHMPIDAFFRSLADDQGSNSIGVILSGTANDGTLGLAAIKDSAGITFAQDTTSAKYDGMPSSAIASGVVDYVLSPDRIAQELIVIQNQPSVPEPTINAFDGKDRLMKDVFRLLKNFSRVDFVDYKVATIRRRILRRMHINHVTELPDHVKLLHRNPQEVEALYRDVLINVTSFLRNPEVFESLHEVVYPKILADRSPSEPVRVWVPGCSTGEETYSHAISLVETFSERRIEVPIQIFGTDLSENAIQRAGWNLQGEYWERGFRGATPPLLPQGYGRIPDFEIHPRHVCFRPPECFQRSALFAHGSDQLPQRAHLSESCIAEEGDSHLPLRPETERIFARRQHRRVAGIRRGDFRSGRPKKQNLSEETCSFSGHIRSHYQCLPDS